MVAESNTDIYVGIMRTYYNYYYNPFITRSVDTMCLPRIHRVMSSIRSDAKVNTQGNYPTFLIITCLINVPYFHDTCKPF